MSDEQISHVWLKLHRLEDQIKLHTTWEAHQLYRTLYGYKSRVERLQSAMSASLPLAARLVAVKLAGLDLTMVWSILASVLHDIALYYCGSALLGTAIGAGTGAMAGGVGAVPGAAIGMAAGMQLGTWLMTFLGLKMFAEGLTETVPQAFRCYMDGVHAAWGPATQDRFDARYPTDSASSERMAEYSFAQGHVLMIVGMLTAMVFYFTHGGGDEALLQAIRASKRIGPRMAEWVAKNKDILRNHPALKPRVRRTAAQEDVPEATRRTRGPVQQRASGVAASDGPNTGTSGNMGVPDGYIQNPDGTVTGPKGGTYTPTGTVDANGNPIYVGGNGNYYTLSADGSTRIPSPNPPSGIGETGQIGEDHLQSLGGQSQVTFQTSQGPRMVDQLTVGNIANESKVGYTSLDADTALQISKDTELLNTGAVNGVTWHFFTSPVTGLGGPSPGLSNALSNAGINMVIH